MDRRSLFALAIHGAGIKQTSVISRFPDSNSMSCFSLIINTLYEFRYGEEMKNRHMAHGLLANRS